MYWTGQLLKVPIMMLTKQQNKTRTTCKTNNYDAFFFFKRRQQKWKFIKKSNLNTSNQKIRNRWRPQLQNCRINYSQNCCLMSYKGFCLLWFLTKKNKHIICMMHDAIYQSAYCMKNAVLKRLDVCICSTKKWKVRPTRYT